MLPVCMQCVTYLRWILIGLRLAQCLAHVIDAATVDTKLHLRNKRTATKNQIWCITALNVTCRGGNNFYDFPDSLIN